MSNGRTIWWAKDALWHDREHVVILGSEFGAAGPLTLDVLNCQAKLENDGGRFKTGYISLARKAHSDEATVRAIVARAIELGALDDFEEHRLTFSARISGWKSDQDRASAAWRKAKQRNGASDDPDDFTPLVTPCPGESRPVPKCPTTEQNRTVQNRETSTPLSAAPTGVVSVFEAWVASTGRTSATKLDSKRRRIISNALKLYPLQDILDAVDGWRFSPHHRGENESGTVYNDIEVLLRSSKQVEKFRDLKRGTAHLVGTPSSKVSAVASLHQRLNQAEALRLVGATVIEEESA